MAHSRPIPRASLSRLPRDHFLTRPGSHLFSGWPRATIRDLSIVLLLRRISPYTFRISPKPPSLRPSPTYRVSAPCPPPALLCPSSTVSPPRRSSRRTDIPSRTMSIYPPSGMILHPGAHFGDSPTSDSGESRAPLGATPNREPAVGAPLSGCFQSRVHWPALTLRHRHPVVRRHLQHRVCFTDEAFVPAAADRFVQDGVARTDGEKGKAMGKPGSQRQDGETRETRRVLKFRRLHLIHSSAVTARQTVADSYSAYT